MTQNYTRRSQWKRWMLSIRFWMRNLWSAVSTTMRFVSPVSESSGGDSPDVFVYWIDGVGVCSGVTFIVRVDDGSSD